MNNPTLTEKYAGVTCGAVKPGRHVIVGAGSVILPGVAIAEGTSVGALSLATKSLESWGVYFGCPVKRLKGRSRDPLEVEAQLTQETAQFDALADGRSPDAEH
ncbi:MAG: hypothetical protein ACKVQQ_21305 [Burkholderiales bacterium]